MNKINILSFNYYYFCLVCLIKAFFSHYLQMRERLNAAKEVIEKKKERQRLMWYSLWVPVRDNEMVGIYISYDF